MTSEKDFSLTNSKRLPEHRMTMINDILVPAIQGTCYHAILCSLFSNKNKFVTSSKLLELVEEYMIMYGGSEAWKDFAYRKMRKRSRVRSRIFDCQYVLKKIRTNIYTLTRVGKKNNGYRLHVRGIAIYYFKDGAMARTGGKFIPARGRRPYTVKFKDGTELQVRKRGQSITYREYKDIIGNVFYEEPDNV